MKIVKSISGTYVAKVTTSHGRRTIKLGVSSYADALKLAKDRRLKETELIVRAGMVERASLAQFITGRIVSLEEAVEEFLQWMESRATPKTRLNLKTILRAWMGDGRLGELSTHEITEAMIDKWINRDNGVKASTKGQHLNAIKQLFDFCANRSYAVGNPAAEVRIRRELLSHSQQETSRTLPFSPAQYETLLNAFRSDIRELELRLAGDGLSDGPRRLLGVKLGQLQFWEVASETSWATGLRLSDVCTLEKGSLTVPGKLMKTTRKTGSRIEIPLRPQLQAKLRAVAALSTSIYVFTDEAWIYEDLSKRSSLSNWFSRYAKRLGIDRSFHGLRAGAATEDNRRGMPMAHIQRKLGHASQVTTEGYIS